MDKFNTISMKTRKTVELSAESPEEAVKKAFPGVFAVSLTGKTSGSHVEVRAKERVKVMVDDKEVEQERVVHFDVEKQDA